MAGMAALVGLVAAGLVVSSVYAQRGGARGSGPRGGRTGGMAAMLGQMGVTPAEQTAVEEAMRKKQAAFEKLRGDMEKLQQLAERPDASPAELQRAVSGYLAARDRTLRQASDVDRGLMRKLSPRTQAKMLGMGVLDNGFGRGMGMMGGRHAGGSGGIRGGGTRGRRGGGGR